MEKTIDGSKSLPDQESAIQMQEATGCELLGFIPLTDDCRKNTASFLALPAGQRPTEEIRLIATSKPPEGVVCFATIYVDSKLTPVAAYR